MHDITQPIRPFSRAHLSNQFHQSARNRALQFPKRLIDNSTEKMIVNVTAHRQTEVLDTHHHHYSEPVRVAGHGHAERLFVPSRRIFSKLAQVAFSADSMLAKEIVHSKALKVVSDCEPFSGRICALAIACPYDAMMAIPITYCSRFRLGFRV